MDNFVDFNSENICKIEVSAINEYIEKALNNSEKKYRYCLHKNPQEDLHEMIIVTTKDDVKRPDKHLYTCESNIILKGELIVILFSEYGEIEDVFKLNPNETFYYRCEKNQYHMTIPLTDVAVYIEIKNGPFDERQTTFPNWAPKKEDKENSRLFCEEIKLKAIKILEKKNKKSL